MLWTHQEQGYLEDWEEGNIELSTRAFRKEKPPSSVIIQMKMLEAVLNVVNRALECLSLWPCRKLF